MFGPWDTFGWCNGLETILFHRSQKWDGPILYSPLNNSNEYISSSFLLGGVNWALIHGTEFKIYWAFLAPPRMHGQKNGSFNPRFADKDSSVVLDFRENQPFFGTRSKSRQWKWWFTMIYRWKNPGYRNAKPCGKSQRNHAQPSSVAMVKLAGTDGTWNRTWNNHHLIPVLLFSWLLLKPEKSESRYII